MNRLINYIRVLFLNYKIQNLENRKSKDFIQVSRHYSNPEQISQLETRLKEDYRRELNLLIKERNLCQTL